MKCKHCGNKINEGDVICEVSYKCSQKCHHSKAHTYGELCSKSDCNFMIGQIECIPINTKESQTNEG